MAQTVVFSSRVNGVAVVYVALAVILGAQVSLGRRLPSDLVTSRVMKKQIEETAEQGSTAPLPPHMAKYAAFGEDLEAFIRNAEQNSDEGGLALGGLMEANATSAEATEGKTVSQNTFCPRQWRTKLAKTAKYVVGGAFGKVYVSKLICQPSVAMAIKVQKKTRDTDKEAALMEGMDHPHVVKAFQHADGPKRSQFSLLMEACSGGDLENVASLPEGQKARLLYETFLGVAYMHEMGFVHADLKLENVMLSEPCSRSGAGCHSKVADLGLTCSTKKSRDCDGVAGTPIYMSPGLVTSGRRTKPDDLWSLGVMTHQLTKGGYPSFLNKPFRSIDQLLDVIGKLRTSRYKYKAKGNSAKEQLLSGLLTASSSGRLTAEAAAELAKQWALEAGLSSDELAGGSKAEMPCWEEKPEAADTLEDAKQSAAAEAGDAEEADLLEVRMRKGVSGGLGFTTEKESPTVIKVKAGGKAEEAGLQVGDVIKTIQHRPWDSLSYAKRLEIIRLEQVVTLEVRRG